MARKLKAMTASQLHLASRLSPLVAAVRTAVDSHADWAETDNLSRIGSSAHRYYD